MCKPLDRTWPIYAEMLSVRWCACLTRRKEVYFRKKGSTSKCEGEHPVSHYHWSTKKIFRSRRQSKVKNNPVADADERPVFGEIFLARSPFDKGKRPTISCLLIEIVLVHPHDAREDVRRVSRVKSPRGIH